MDRTLRQASDLSAGRHQQRSRIIESGRILFKIQTAARTSIIANMFFSDAQTSFENEIGWECQPAQQQLLDCSHKQIVGAVGGSRPGSSCRVASEQWPHAGKLLLSDIHSRRPLFELRGSSQDFDCKSEPQGKMAARGQGAAKGRWMISLVAWRGWASGGAIGASCVVLGQARLGTT